MLCADGAFIPGTIKTRVTGAGLEYHTRAARVGIVASVAVLFIIVYVLVVIFAGLYRA